MQLGGNSGADSWGDDALTDEAMFTHLDGLSGLSVVTLGGNESVVFGQMYPEQADGSSVSYDSVGQ